MAEGYCPSGTALSSGLTLPLTVVCWSRPVADSPHQPAHQQAIAQRSDEEERKVCTVRHRKEPLSPEAAWGCSLMQRLLLKGKMHSELPGMLTRLAAFPHEISLYVAHDVWMYDRLFPMPSKVTKLGP